MNTDEIILQFSQADVAGLLELGKIAVVIYGLASIVIALVIARTVRQAIGR